MFKNLQMQNKELQDGTKADSEQMPIVILSSPNAAKPNVSGSAFGVFSDSARLDIADKNEIIAIFKHKSHAIKFGLKMWGEYFIVKPIISEHFR